MSAATTKARDPAPDDLEAQQAREAAHALAGAATGPVHLRIEKKMVTVPRRAVPLIAQVMEKLGAGESVEVRTVHDTLSTTEAADLLNVSRPYFIKLLEEGRIPFVATEGNHRRVKRADVLEFQRRQDAESRKLADELAAEGQRLNREYNLER
jgi:excisionase family DNA binding protein